MRKKKILFVYGSLNHTTMMFKIYQHLKHYYRYFRPFCSDGFLNLLASNGFLDFTILGGQARIATLQFIQENHLSLNDGAVRNDYDLFVSRI